MELTVLGCSGSYGAPFGRRVQRVSRARRRHDDLDGLRQRHLPLNLQRHLDPGDLSAVVITHEHPDHCVDLYGLHVLWRYGLERTGVPVFAPVGAEERSGRWSRAGGPPSSGTRSTTVTRRRVGAIDLRFSRTDHPPPTFAVEGGSRRPPAGLHVRHGPGMERRRVRSRARTSCCRRRRTCTTTPDRHPSLGPPGRRSRPRDGRARAAGPHASLAPGRPGRARSRKDPRHSAGRSRWPSLDLDAAGLTASRRPTKGLHGDPQRRA